MQHLLYRLHVRVCLQDAQNHLHHFLPTNDILSIVPAKDCLVSRDEHDRSAGALDDVAWRSRGSFLGEDLVCLNALASGR